ncbi:MAG: hypothetical protein K2J66_08850 [Muribaculaceae bacterium]|nr:hypothetical protein [Muribaculaceae bacterium]
MPGPNPKKRQIKFSMFWMYAIILLFLAGIFYLDDNTIEKEENYTEFENLVAPDDSARHNLSGITKLVIDTKKGRATAYLSDSLASTIFPASQFTPGRSQEPKIWTKIGDVGEFQREIKGWKSSGRFNAPVQYEEGSSIGTYIWSFGPIVLLIVFWILIMRRMSGRDGSGGGVFSVGKSKAQIFDKDGPNKVTFKDVAGLSEAKTEIEDIVECLKNTQRYT